MKPILTACLCLSVLSSGAQIAKSFNFNGKNTTGSGTYSEYDELNDCFYTAAQKKVSITTQTVISKIDGHGTSTWHTVINHAGGITNEYATCDIRLKNNYLFVSVFKCPTPSTANLTVYKINPLGAVLDSAVIDAPGGIELIHPETDFDSDNNLFTAVQDNSGNIHFCKINPVTMDILDQQVVASTTLVNGAATRGLFAEFNGTHSVIAYNAPGEVKFVKLDASASVVGGFTVPSPDGELTDFDFHDNEYYLLINEHFTASLPADNPLRLIKTNALGTVTANGVFPVQHALVFENLAVDDNDDIYVAARGQMGSFTNGCVLKVIGSTIYYEHELNRTNLYEIDISGNYFFASGAQDDYVTDCVTDADGSALIRRKKTEVPQYAVVSPHMDLEFNNINAVIAYNSTNFNDYANEPAIKGYSIDGAGATIYSSSLLINGEDLNGAIKASTQIYANVYAAGPITTYADYTTIERDKWERVWIVSRAEIDAHVAAFQAGDPTYKIPEAIRNWPGNGDPAKGQSAQLARYMDLNGNGIYEPGDGEYPLIIGDYCALSVYNDMNTGFFPDILSNCDHSPIGVEVHEYVYGFNCTDDSSLQNTLYVHYEIINAGTQALYNGAVGSFIDMDINYSNDDYISSDPMRSMFYGRNGVAAGEPEQAFVILGSTQDPDGIDNAAGIGPNESPNGTGYGDGIEDNERLGMTNFVYFNNSGGANGNPESNMDFYRYMRSIWKNGQPVLFGGNGFNAGTTPLESTYMFQGDADQSLFYATDGIDPSFTWTEETAGNPPADRRGLASSGPFMIYAMDTILYDVVFVTGMENLTAGYSSHDALIENVDSARNYYHANATSCGQDFDFYAPFTGTYPYLGNEENTTSLLSLFPNPTAGNMTLSGLKGTSQISVYSVSGQLIQSGTATTASVSFDVTNLPAGVYFLQVSSDTHTETLKFTKH